MGGCAGKGAGGGRGGGESCAERARADARPRPSRPGRALLMMVPSFSSVMKISAITGSANVLRGRGA